VAIGCEKTIALPHVTDKLNHLMLYTVPLTMNNNKKLNKPNGSAKQKEKQTKTKETEENKNMIHGDIRKTLLQTVRSVCPFGYGQSISC
jgi:hypothetical protein